MSTEDQRRELHDAIQGIINTVSDEETNARHGVLVGWVVVAEWAGDDGNRWLTKMNGNPSGEAVPTWQENGYLYEALHTRWPTAADDDE